MFYNHDYITSKKAGLRIVWLASTLGKASRRLSKREIAGVDVAKTCENVARPREPLALRTSSHLMYGVVRVYTQQAEYWMADVQANYATIRKVMTQSSGPTKQLGGLLVAGGDTTCIDMPGRGRPTRDTITLPSRFDYFAGHPSFDFEWGTNDVIGDSDPFIPSLASVLPSQAGSRSSHLRSGERAVGLDSSSLRGGRYTMHPTQIRRAHRTSSPAAEMAPFGFESILPELQGGEGLDLGLDDVEETGFEFGLDDGPENGLALPLDRHQLDDMMLDWQDAPKETSFLEQSLSSPLRQRQRSSSLDAQAVQSRPKRTRFALADSSIELSNEDVLQSRENYASIMATKRVESNTRGLIKRCKSYAIQQLFGPAQYLLTSNALTVLWNENVTASLSMKRSSSSAVEQVDLPALSGLEARSRETGEIGAQMHFDDIDMPQWEDEPGMARGAISSSSPVWASEIGRGTQSSEKRSNLPWNMPFASVEGPDTTFGDTTSQHSLRSFSLETPTGLRRPSKRQSSFGAVSVGQEQEQQLRDEEVLPQLDSPALDGHDIMEREVQKFLSYTVRVRNQLPVDQPLFFSDLAPIADSTPYIAARAFYHTLALTTAKHIHVEQQVPFGEIKIEIVAT